MLSVNLHEAIFIVDLLSEFLHAEVGDRCFQLSDAIFYIILNRWPLYCQSLLLAVQKGLIFRAKLLDWICLWRVFLLFFIFDNFLFVDDAFFFIFL